MSQQRRALLLVMFSLSGLSANATCDSDLKSCVGNPVLQAEQSARLQVLVSADQADRKAPVDWSKVSPRDLERRIEVGKLFAQGCLASAADYAAAAMIYQHGDTADHSYQAFVWSSRGVELGDQSQRWLLGASLDRHLVRSGRKQLFATQASKSTSEPCWCLETVEETFPEDKRTSYVKRSLAEALVWIQELNKPQTSCADVRYCSNELRATPSGSVPGFW